ncbi:unnamed protein product [Symbiodinium sp. KB8]|nr:unnamed protein product [Symbiodinium sp. KB8]
MRIREMRLPVFNPDTDSVIGTLYAAQNFVPGAVAHKVAEDVVGHFTFNVSELPNPLDNPERIQMQFGLMAFDGAIAGYISFLMKAQHRGAVVDDWTDMRMGARHYGMVPEPSEEARAAARRAGLRASRAGGKSGAAIAASDAAAHAHLGRYVVQDDGDVAFAVGLDEDGADKRLSWLPGSSGDGAGGKDDLDGPVLRTKGRSSSVQRLASNPMLAARASTASVAPPSAIVPPARSAVDSSTATILAAASSGSMGNTTKGRAANTVIATSHRSLLAARQRHSMLEGEKRGGGSRRASRRRPSLAKEANQASLRGMLGLYAKAEVEEFGTEDGGTDLQPFEERGRAGSAFSVSSNPLQGARKLQSGAPANPAPNRASDTLPQPATVLEAASRSAPQGKQAPRHPELAPSLPADMPSSGGLNPLAMLNVFAPSRRDSASARRQFGLGQRASAKAAGTSAHDGRSRTRRTQGTTKGSAVAAGGPGYTSGAALHRMRGETAEQAEQAVGMDVALASALASGVDESGGLFGSSQVDVSSATKPPRGLKVLGLPHELAAGLPPNGMPLLPAPQKKEEHHQTPLMKQAWGWSSIASGVAV